MINISTRLFEITNERKLSMKLMMLLMYFILFSKLQTGITALSQELKSEIKSQNLLSELRKKQLENRYLKCHPTNYFKTNS